MSMLILPVVIFAVAVAGMFMIAKWDKPIFTWGRQLWLVAMGAFMEGVVIQSFLGELAWRNSYALGIFAGCLLLASITDSVFCQVYNFVWWVAYVAGGILLWAAIGQWREVDRDCAAVDALLQLVLFCLLQFYVFGRTYGRADCYAFCACAVVETALGMTMEGYLSHMILAYLLLIAVQALRRNISRRGRLKRPVPFLPYISVSFWTTIILLC